MQLLAHGTKQITTLLLDANLFLLLEKEQIHTLHQRILPCFHLQMCQRYAVKLGFVLHVTQIQCIGLSLIHIYAAHVEEGKARALQCAVTAAREGVEKAKMMQARHGRLAFRQENSIGMVDPGSVVAALYVEGMQQGLRDEE